MDERTTLTETMNRMSEVAASEERMFNEGEEAALAGIQTRCEEIDPQLERYNAQLQSMRAYAELQARLETTRELATANGGESRRPSAAMEYTSWGQAFVDSDQFRTYNGVGSSGRFEIEGYLEQRAAITTSALAIPHMVIPPVEQTFRSALLEVVGRVTVSSGVVDWVEVGADPVAVVVAEGAPKPEATFTMTPKTSSLDTIAHWIQITRQALDDASYIRSLIESKLRRGLLAKAEADMAAAIDAATTQTASAADLSTSIRVGVGKVEGAGYTPNAVVLNPADYAALDVASAAVVNPASGAPYWGLRPVAAAAITAGKVYVGDFASGATLFDRGVTNVFLSDSHASLFISNILVILAEARLKSAVTEPLAICECVATP